MIGYKSITEALVSAPYMLFTKFDDKLLGIVYNEPLLLVEVGKKNLTVSFSFNIPANMSAHLAIDLHKLCTKHKYELNFVNQFLLFEDKILYGEQAIGAKFSYLSGKLKYIGGIQ